MYSNILNSGSTHHPANGILPPLQDTTSKKKEQQQPKQGAGGAPPCRERQPQSMKGTTRAITLHTQPMTYRHYNIPARKITCNLIFPSSGSNHHPANCILPPLHTKHHHSLSKPQTIRLHVCSKIFKFSGSTHHPTNDIPPPLQDTTSKKRGSAAPA